MRVTIEDWKKDWIETNGSTDELEVIIKDGGLKKSDTWPDEGVSLYEGSFAKIPDELLGKKVIKWAQIVASSEPKRDGCYSLTV
nr:hypothetical protein [Serratia marcescens]